MKFSDTFRTPQVNCPLCSHCPFPPPSNPVTTDPSVSYLTLVCLVWECVEARGWLWVCAHRSSPCFEDKASHWTWKSPVGLDWLASKSQGSRYLCLLGAGIIGALLCPVFLWVRGTQTQVVIACVAGPSLIPCQPCHLHLTTMHWFVFLTTRVSYLLDLVSLGH